MILKFTYRQKLKALPFLFMAALMLVYLMAVSDTIELRSSCNELTVQMISADDAPKQLASFTARLDELNGMAGNSNSGEGTDPLLNFISMHSTSSNKLINYLPLHFYQNQLYLIETRIAVYEGSYRSLLEFLFAFEKSYPSGKVVSVKFETETNAKSGKKRLLMTLYIQSITNEKDNSAKDQTTTNA